MCEHARTAKALRNLGRLPIWALLPKGALIQENETFLSALLIKGYSILLVVKLIGWIRTIYHHILDADLLCFT